VIIHDKLSFFPVDLKKKEFPTVETILDIVNTVLSRFTEFFTVTYAGNSVVTRIPM
jgi:hypothetical protein